MADQNIEQEGGQPSGLTYEKARALLAERQGDFMADSAARELANLKSGNWIDDTDAQAKMDLIRSELQMADALDEQEVNNLLADLYEEGRMLTGEMASSSGDDAPVYEVLTPATVITAEKAGREAWASKQDQEGIYHALMDALDRDPAQFSKLPSEIQDRIIEVVAKIKDKGIMAGKDLAKLAKQKQVPYQAEQAEIYRLIRELSATEARARYTFKEVMPVTPAELYTPPRENI